MANISSIKLPNNTIYTLKDNTAMHGSTLELTLTTAGWSSKQQSVTAMGVSTSNIVIVSPAPASYNDYCASGVYCYSQATNSLTFKCSEVPSAALTVNVLIIG